MQYRFHRLAPALALGLPMLVLAQSRSDPADSKAPARALAHASAFADYQPFGDIAPGDWRRLNDALAGPALKQSELGATAAAPSGSAPTHAMLMGDMPMRHAPRKYKAMHQQTMHGGQK